ncbi:MAG: dihydropteroate synthase [Actinobacteria bacterium]|nr:dihydropteroate synthase [Actinomycetota bacterium]
MGVLNVTPDSFSDGGEHDSLQQALLHGELMLAQGAQVIDVGGESTRPGAQPVDPSDEQRRVVPVIEALADLLAGTSVRLSIDTRNASTAIAAVGAGASLINDVSASLWGTAADLGVGWVAMHMQADPRTMQNAPVYEDVVSEVRAFLAERAGQAVAAGVEEVWVDPGIGFGKTTKHNLDLLGHLDQLVAEGFPVVVGTSRKRFLGELIARSDDGLGPFTEAELPSALPGETRLVPTNERADGSLATAMWALIQGAQMVRVHEVESAVQAAKILSGNILIP